VVAVRISSFGGIAPKINARYLPDSAAQTALNVDTTRQGSLLPTSSFGSSLRTLPAGTYKTLFRYNEDYVVEDGSWWLASPNDIDFCRGQIIDDTSEILYFTNNDNQFIKPQFTYNLYVTSAGGGLLNGYLYGAGATFNLGVPKPTLAPSVSTSPPAETDGLSVEFRTYVFTYVYTKAGRTMESGPSPASASPVEVYLDSGQTVTVNTLTTAVPYAKMASYEVTKRIYRSVSGSFLFVDEIPVTQQTFVDAVDPDALGEVIPSLTWDIPPDDLNGLTNMANGIMAGFVGRDVYFCEPYIPHAWPRNYAVSVASPIVGLASLDTTLVALTNERPYFIQGSDPSLMTVVEADISQGCVAKRSIATLNGEVFYASPDGLMAVSPRGSRIVTEQIFSYRQWNELLDPSTIYGYVHDLKYFGFHSTGAFIYDLPTQQFVTLDVTGVAAAYADLRLDKLYVVDENDRIVAWGDGSASEYDWKSKIFTMPREVSFGFIQIEAEAYPLNYTVYADGAAILSGVVSDRNLFRLPSVLARDWEIYLNGNKEVFSVAMAQSGEEIANV
jgi:hypothetical protein